MTLNQTGGDWVAQCAWGRDAETIAHAPTDVAQLIAEVKALRQVCGEVAWKLQHVFGPTRPVWGPKDMHALATRLEAAAKGDE